MRRQKIPPLSVKEQEAQAALIEAVRRLLAIRNDLVQAGARFGKVKHEGAMAAGIRPCSVAFVLRSTLECLLHDRLDPMIRDLTAAGQITPLALAQEWQHRTSRKT